MPACLGPWLIEASLRLNRGAGAGCVVDLVAFCRIAGDILVAGLLDLGVPKDELEDAVSGLELEA